MVHPLFCFGAGNLCRSEKERRDYDRLAYTYWSILRMDCAHKMGFSEARIAFMRRSILFGRRPKQKNQILAPSHNRNAFL